jgi:hypothetical protein
MPSDTSLGEAISFISQEMFLFPLFKDEGQTALFKGPVRTAL